MKRRYWSVRIDKLDGWSRGRAMDFDALVPYQVCINLDRRPDRWHRMRRRIARWGLRSVVRFPAIDGHQEERPAAWAERPGEWGCLRSHLEVVRSARRAKAPGVLILEDDADLGEDWRVRLAAAWSSLADDWELLYLGCNHIAAPIPFADGVARVVQAHSTFAYIVRASAYDAFLAVNHRSDRPLDVNLLRLQRERVCSALWPNVAWVDEGHSDVQQSHESHWYLRESVLVTPEAVADLAGRSLLFIPLSSIGWRTAPPEALDFQVRQFAEAFPGLAVALEGDSPAARARPDRAILAAIAGQANLSDVRTFAGLRPGQPVRGEPLCMLTDRFGEGYRFLLCAGSPVHLPTRLLRAAVQMCRRFELVLPFRQARPLSSTQTQALLAGRSRWYDPTQCPGRGQSARRLGWWFLDIEAARRCDPATPAYPPNSCPRRPRAPAGPRRSPAGPLGTAGDRQFPLFEAPSLALRLAPLGPTADSVPGPILAH